MNELKYKDKNLVIICMIFILIFSLLYIIKYNYTKYNKLNLKRMELINLKKSIEFFEKEINSKDDELVNLLSKTNLITQFNKNFYEEILLFFEKNQMDVKLNGISIIKSEIVEVEKFSYEKDYFDLQVECNSIKEFISFMNMLVNKYSNIKINSLKVNEITVEGDTKIDSRFVIEVYSYE